MVAERSKPRASAPPRTLNVQKFAESRAHELQSLHCIVATRLNNDFRSQRNKRRRTTGHQNKKFRKKQKFEGASAAASLSNGLLENDQNMQKKKKKEKIPRRIRRRIELKKNPQTGFSISGDGIKRLRTHVWHAKRFTMSKLWGFYLPLGLHGRGKGSRAVLKKLEQGVLVHDASFYAAVQLEGPEDLLLSILGTVMVPSPSGNSSQTSTNILSGVIYDSAMLHHVSSHSAQAVAPVTYMWRPQNPNFDAMVDKTDTYNEQKMIDGYVFSRQLWIWIHPAAFSEGYDVLKSACDTTNLNGRSVSCLSLEGDLAKLDLIGLRAFQLMQKILHPLTCPSMNSWTLQRCSVAVNNDRTPPTKSCTLPREDQISPSAIISLTVNDPRAATSKGVAFVSEAAPFEILDAKEAEIQGDTTAEDILPLNSDSLSQLLLNLEKNFKFSEVIDLWDVHKGVNPPVEERFLCKAKHHQLMKYFNISDGSSRTLDASGVQQSSLFCPIMLLKDNSAKGRARRWSIILPLSWVKAFWVAIISSGAQAIGLREKRWVTCEAGLPYFPSDFPDTNAYSCSMEKEAAIADQKENLQPPALRPLRVPHFTPWDCIRYGSQERCTAGVAKTFPVSHNSMKNLNCKNCEIAVVGGHGALCNGFVARTSSMLIHFMTHVNDDHLLFSNSPNGKRCLPKVMNDNDLITQQTNGFSSQFTCCQKQCLVRVLLRAHKEGVFEEGDVVCAPHASDVTMWSTRSDGHGGKLQVPQSLLDSYIIQQPCGRWALQVPEDPAIRESFRWPIGFIISGFVRGSKRPMAIALCEAVLLARLREQQWRTISVRKRKKEIYVLVRNLRSTAYRLALATIVLEEQDEDVEYL